MIQCDKMLKDRFMNSRSQFYKTQLNELENMESKKRLALLEIEAVIKFMVPRVKIKWIETR